MRRTRVFESHGDWREGCRRAILVKVMHPVGAETILLVEDEALVRSVASMTLRAAGYRVLDAASPEEAIAMSAAHEGPIRVLVSDVAMPTMSGPELARALSASRPDLRVVLSSGYGEESVSGVKGARFLAKPYLPDALLRIVREAIDGPRH